MPAIAIRQSAVQAMTVKQRRIARWVLSSVGLTAPAAFTAPGGNVWLVFDDHRIDLRDVAYFGRFAALLAQLPAGWDPPDGWDDLTAGQVRALVREWLSSRVVWPVDVPEGEDPWQTVLDAQNAPAGVRAGNSVPTTWVPVE